MPERVEYQRNPDIGSIGLTQTDIDQRAVIAVGYAQNELLPPYTDSKHQEKSQAILEYFAKQIKTISFDNYIKIARTNYVASFPNTKVIEIVGGVADLCVPQAIWAVTQQRLYALVNTRMTFATNTSYQDFTLGKIILREANEFGAKCLIIGREQYVFYI